MVKMLAKDMDSGISMARRCLPSVPAHFGKSICSANVVILVNYFTETGVDPAMLPPPQSNVIVEDSH